MEWKVQEETSKLGCVSLYHLNETMKSTFFKKFIFWTQDAASGVLVP